MRQATMESNPMDSGLEAVLAECRATAAGFNSRSISEPGLSKQQIINKILKTDPLDGFADAAFSAVKDIKTKSTGKERSAGKFKARGFTAGALALGLVASLTGANFAGADPRPGHEGATESPADEALADALTPSGFINENACVNIVEARSPDMVFTTTDADGNTIRVISQDVRLTHPVGSGPNALRWSDSVSTPLEGSNARQMERDFFYNLCTDPALLAETAAGLADFEVDGVRLADTNEWLQRHLGPASRIDNVAEGYAPLFGETGTPTDAELAEAVEGNVQAQADAARVIALFRHMQRTGVVNAQSGLSVHVKEFGMDIDGDIPEFENVSPYFGEFLTFTVTSKTDGCVAVIGINTGDKRMTVLRCEEPTPEQPEQPGVTSTPENPENPQNPPHRRPPTETPPPPDDECVPGDDECPIEEPPEPTCDDDPTLCPEPPEPPEPPDDGRPEDPGVGPDPITGPGAGGNPDDNNNPDDDPGYVDDPDPVDPEVPVEEPVDQVPDEDPANTPVPNPATDPGDPTNIPG